MGFKIISPGVNDMLFLRNNATLVNCDLEVEPPQVEGTISFIDAFRQGKGVIMDQGPATVQEVNYQGGANGFLIEDETAGDILLDGVAVSAEANGIVIDNPVGIITEPLPVVTGSITIRNAQATAFGLIPDRASDLIFVDSLHHHVNIEGGFLEGGRNGIEVGKGRDVIIDGLRVQNTQEFNIVFDETFDRAIVRNVHLSRSKEDFCLYVFGPNSERDFAVPALRDVEMENILCTRSANGGVETEAATNVIAKNIVAVNNGFKFSDLRERRVGVSMGFAKSLVMENIFSANNGDFGIVAAHNGIDGGETPTVEAHNLVSLDHPAGIGIVLGGKDHLQFRGFPENVQQISVNRFENILTDAGNFPVFGLPDADDDEEDDNAGKGATRKRKRKRKLQKDPSGDITVDGNTAKDFLVEGAVITSASNVVAVSCPFFE
ncbi:MAG: hypothetical protein SGILL_010086 [Bacillariaceae sp.]